MSLESILKRINSGAEAEADKIIQDAKREAQNIIQQAKKEAQDIYQEILNKEKAALESQKQKLIVNARLKNKMQLLSVKQELMDSVFKELKAKLDKAKLKKEEISHEKRHLVSEDVDFYLKQIRPDFEREIARILFS